MRIIALLFILTIAVRAGATDFNFTADGGLLNSRWDYTGQINSFSLLSRSSSRGSATVGLGSNFMEFVAGAEVTNYDFTAPNSRVLVEPKGQALDMYGGGRMKLKWVWLHALYDRKQLLYLDENPSNTFTIKKAPTGFLMTGLTLFGFGDFYKLTLTGEYGMPVSKPTTSAGDMKSGNIMRAVVRWEVGGFVRFGLSAGIENQDYEIGTAKNYRSDFFGGLVFSSGASKNSLKGSSRSYSGGYFPGAVSN